MILLHKTRLSFYLEYCLEYRRPYLKLAEHLPKVQTGLYLVEYELFDDFRPRQLMFQGKLIEGCIDIVGEYKVVLLLVGRILSRLSGTPTPLDFGNVELFFTCGRVVTVEKVQ